MNNMKTAVFLILFVLLAGCGDYNEAEIAGQLLTVGATPNDVSLEVTRTGAWNKTRIRVRVYYIGAADDPIAPSDHDYALIVGGIGEMMEKAQRFFGTELERHGYGYKTFEIFRNPDGSVAVDCLTLANPISHYMGKDGFHVFERDLADVPRSVIASNVVSVYFVDFPRRASYLPGGYGGAYSTSGFAVIFTSRGWSFKTLCHELGHAFGLHHDWRDDSYIMSYGHDRAWLSAGAAGWLARHGAFNENATPGSHNTLAKHNLHVLMNVDLAALSFTMPLRIYRSSVEDKDPSRSYDYAVLLNTTSRYDDVIAYTDDITMEIRIGQLWDGDNLMPERKIMYDIDFEGTLPEDCEEFQILLMGKGRYVAHSEWFSTR